MAKNMTYKTWKQQFNWSVEGTVSNNAALYWMMARQGQYRPALYSEAWSYGVSKLYQLPGLKGRIQWESRLAV